MEFFQVYETADILPEPDFGPFWRLDAQELALKSLQSIIHDLEALQNHMWELRGLDFRTRTLLPAGTLYNPAREFWDQAGMKYLEVMACVEHLTSIDPSTMSFVYASALSVAEFKFRPLGAVSKMPQLLQVLFSLDWLHTKEKAEHFARGTRAGMENDEVMESTRADLIANVTKLQGYVHTVKIELMEMVGFFKHAMHEAL